MKLINHLYGKLFSGIDRPLERLQEIRNSYRELNVEIYGEQLARILNEW